MIVDGSVSIAGPFRSTGLIVARGPIVATTNELSLTGAMLSFANPPAGQFAIDLGGGVVRFSPCVVDRAFCVTSHNCVSFNNEIGAEIF